MALAARPRSSPNNENALPTVAMHAGKTTQPSGLHLGGPTGRPGLKQQQPAGNERRILSDISNSRNKPRPSVGTPKPSPNNGFGILRNENILPKASAPAPPQTTQGKSQPQPQERPQARVPLRIIVNESLPVPSRTPTQSKKQPIQRRRPGFKVKLTEEQLRQAEEWAKEDLPVEKVHFTERDMEALREKMMDAEIEETVNMVRNFRVEKFNAYSESEPVKEELNPMYYEDGRLKPDLHNSSYDLALEGLAEIELPMAEPDVQLDDFLNDDSFQYPRIPDVWLIAQND